MEGFPLKYYLLTHNDLDGVGCGIIAKCAFGNKVEVKYNSVSSLNFQVERFLEKGAGKGTYLLITDLSVHEQNEKGLDDYMRSGGKVKLIDHHKTALHLNQYPWAMVQVEYEDHSLASATSLFYQFLIQNGLISSSESVDEFVQLVRQYDTWEWEKHGNSKAKRLNDLFFMLSIDEFEEKMIERLRSGKSFDFDEFEERILNMEEEKIERYVRRKKRELVQTFIHDRCVGIVHAESYHSELGNELGKENPHLDYVAILNIGGKKVSLRTIHDHTDVSEIASKFGGGGHAKAAGCTMTEEAYRLYVAEPFQLEPVRPDAFRNVFNSKASPQGSLYMNRQDDEFFVHPLDGGSWSIDMNGEPIGKSFASFDQAERYVKRQYQAWLARDDEYVRFLVEQVVRVKQAPVPV
jgi:uncharacterized protein